jgi:hypothetical protein
MLRLSIFVEFKEKKLMISWQMSPKTAFSLMKALKLSGIFSSIVFCYL